MRLPSRERAAAVSVSALRGPGECAHRNPAAAFQAVEHFRSAVTSARPLAWSMRESIATTPGRPPCTPRRLRPDPAPGERGPGRAARSLAGRGRGATGPRGHDTASRGISLNLRSRVSTFPRKGTTSRSDRGRRIMALRLGLDVPILAPRGRSANDFLLWRSRRPGVAPCNIAASVSPSGI